MQLLGNGQNDIFLPQPLGPKSARIFTAMTGVYRNHEIALAIGGRARDFFRLRALTFFVVQIQH